MSAAPPAVALLDQDGPTAVHFGSGVVGRLGEVLEHYGARNVLLVRGSRSFAAAAPAVAALGRHVAVTQVAQVGPNPTLAAVRAAVRAARALAPDAVVGIGGGSVLDLAKAAAVLAPQPGGAREYLRGAPLSRPRQAALVLAPTTAGSGSEMTPYASVYIAKIKHSLEASALRADVALVDPDLCRTAPVEVAAAAGADALAQAVESTWAVAATPASRERSAAALQLLLPALHDATTRGEFTDPGCARDLAAGAALAGAAIGRTRTTAAHALSYDLTARRGIPHGLAVAAHLRWLLAHNRAATAADCRHPAGPDGLQSIVEGMEAACRRATGGPVAALLARLLRLGAQPASLVELRLRPRAWSPLWTKALASARAGNNPRIVTAADVVAAAVCGAGENGWT